MYKPPPFSLKKLYHPSGLTGGGSLSETSCPCGCNPARRFKAFELGAKQLGIKDTPGMREVAKLEKTRRATERAMRPPRLPSPWRDATITYGEVTLDGKTYPAKIYTKGSAVAWVRADQKKRL